MDNPNPKDLLRFSSSLPCVYRQKKWPRGSEFCEEILEK